MPAQLLFWRRRRRVAPIAKRSNSIGLSRREVEGLHLLVEGASY